MIRLQKQDYRYFRFLFNSLLVAFSEIVHGIFSFQRNSQSHCAVMDITIGHSVIICIMNLLELHQYIFGVRYTKEINTKMISTPKILHTTGRVLCIQYMIRYSALIISNHSNDEAFSRAFYSLPYEEYFYKSSSLHKITK